MNASWANLAPQRNPLMKLSRLESAFGPTILLTLFWKRFNFAGAVAGILSGAAVDILWLVFLSSTGIFELAPGFIASFIVAVVVTLITKAPSKEVEELFDAAVNYTED